MSNQAQDDVYSPLLYSPYSHGQGFENPVQPAHNPDLIRDNADATNGILGNQSGTTPPEIGCYRAQTGFNPAQTGYYPAPVGYNPVQTVFPAGEAANQHTTTVYVQPVPVVVPLVNPPQTYLVQSILVFLFCCWILGLMAILKAVASDSAAKCGRREEAEREAALAKKYNIIGVIIGVVVWAISITGTVLLVIFLPTMINYSATLPANNDQLFSHKYLI